MSLKPVLLDPALPFSELGEGPHWDHRSQMFYWVDITGCTIHKYDMALQKYEFCKTPSSVGFIIPDSEETVIAGLKDGIYRVHFDTGKVTPIVLPEQHADVRFNDGKCDRQGRLWGGTMHNKGGDHPEALGKLYRWDGQSLDTIEEGVFITNGLGWSPDSRTMYFTDTVNRTIWQYDFDPETGTPSNRRIFREFSGAGRPDGLTVDSQGRVLSAQWPGWGVEIFTPDGKPDGVIELPVPQVSSVTFGGPDFKTLFITTASSGMTPEQIAEAPLSGQVFTVEMDVPGLPANCVKS
ncbi:MAG: Transcriptional regulator, IclR family/regucalcin [Alphaproteobacteria bacterium]|nr:Transcriptional regulator, IclR family/regucalcin [Alphaproteobacteria bacterium]